MRQAAKAALRRVERAAGRMNPYLALVVVGLVLINLTLLVLRAPH